MQVQNETWGLCNERCRVLFVACKANSLQEAKDKVYKEIGKIESDGLFYRSDIGYRAIGHEMTKS